MVRTYPTNAKIYIIIHNDKPDMFYIGSTCEKYLSCRLNKHQYEARNRSHIMPLTEYMTQNNYKHFSIFLLEELMVNSFEEQRTIEQKYIMELKPPLNKRNSIYTAEMNREHQKLYMATEHGKNKRRERRIKAKNQNTYYCYDCDISFIEGYGLKNHYKTQSHLQNTLPLIYF
jgi:hypothetical protein